jgi:hypothetical protein
MDEQTRNLDSREYTVKTLGEDALDRPQQIQYPHGEVTTLIYDQQGEDCLEVGIDPRVGRSKLKFGLLNCARVIFQRPKLFFATF